MHTGQNSPLTNLQFIGIIITCMIYPGNFHKTKLAVFEYSLSAQTKLNSR